MPPETDTSHLQGAANNAQFQARVDFDNFQRKLVAARRHIRRLHTLAQRGLTFSQQNINDFKFFDKQVLDCEEELFNLAPTAYPDAEENGSAAVETAQQCKFIEEHLSPTERVNGRASSNSNQTTSSNSFNLKKINLVKFDGEYKNWYVFYNFFKTTVHDNMRMEEDSKYFYLFECLGEEPKAQISHFAYHEYQKAWEALCKVYGDTSTQQSEFLKDMHDLRRIKIVDNHTSLKTYLNAVQSLHGRSVLLQFSNEFINKELVTQFYSMLPKYIREKIMEQDPSTAEEFIEHLEKIVKVKKDSFNVSTRYDFIEQSNNRNRRNPYHQRPVSVNATNSVSENQPRCLFCEGAHKSFKCNNPSLNNHQRCQIAIENRKCFLCLNNHFSNACTSNISCGNCRGRHTTVLCKRVNPNMPSFNQMQSSSNPPRYNHSANPPRFNNSANPPRFNNSANPPRFNNSANPPRFNNSANPPRFNNFANPPRFDSPLNYRASDEGDRQYPSAAPTSVNIVSAEQNTVQEQLSYDSAALIPSTNCVPVLVGCTTDVYYQTTIARVDSSKCRIVLDSASGLSFITREFKDTFNIPTFTIRSRPYTRFGSKQVEYCEMKARVPLTSTDGKTTVELEFFVVDSIGREEFPVLPKYLRQEADNLGYHIEDQNAPVKVLIGLDNYNKVARTKEIRIRDEMIIKDTTFGWVCYGNNDEKGLPVLSVPCCDVDRIIEKENEHVTDSHDDFLQTFIDTSITYDAENKIYSTKLPTITEIQGSHNYQLAKARNRNLIKRLNMQETLAKYSKAMTEFIINNAERANDNIEPEFYLPHQPVVREDKTTTKVRIVMDASAKDSHSPSLNDVLFKGEVVCDNIKLMMNFRLRKFGVVADLEKAYLNIIIHKDDRNKLKFIWTENGQEEIYRMCRVPFGTTASGFLLYAVMQRHLTLMENRYPHTVEALRDAFYVDDFISSVDSINELQVLHDEAIDIFKQASFNIRKWITNDQSTQDEWGRENIKEEIKILGVPWVPDEDLIQIKPSIPLYSVMTKRNLLSIISSIYDPLGLITPIVVPLKLALKRCWDESIEWDQEIPAEVKKKVLRQIQDLNTTVTFPRKFLPCDHPVSLNVCCDASPVAYGVCVYVSCYECKYSSLALSKSKLCKKNVSIPMLELIALEYAKRLTNRVFKYVTPTEVNLFSDSMINIKRLQNLPNKYTYQVARRLVNIKNNSEYIFGVQHINGNVNPADYNTKVHSSAVVHSNLWKHGPTEFYGPRPQPVLLNFVHQDDFRTSRRI